MRNLTNPSTFRSGDFPKVHFNHNYTAGARGAINNIQQRRIDSLASGAQLAKENNHIGEAGSLQSFVLCVCDSQNNFLAIVQNLRSAHTFCSERWGNSGWKKMLALLFGRHYPIFSQRFNFWGFSTKAGGMQRNPLSLKNANLLLRCQSIWCTRGLARCAVRGIT